MSSSKFRERSFALKVLLLIAIVVISSVTVYFWASGSLQPTNVAQLRVEIKKAPKYQIDFDSVIAGFIMLRDLNDTTQQFELKYRWRSDELTKLPDITLGHTYEVEIESGSVHETFQITFAETPRMYHVETEYFDITFLVG